MPNKIKKKGSGLYDAVANKYFNAGLADGEIHAPQYTKRGFKFGSYIGPGTDLYANLRKGKKPVSKSDKVAQAHDLRYSRATTTQEVRTADIKMINKLKSLAENGEDYKFNTYMGMLPIRLKIWAEDAGIIKKGSFSSMKGVKNDDRELSDAKLKELEQEGYGLKKVKKVKVKKVKNKWLLHVSKVKKNNKDLSYKEVLKLASQSY